MGSESIEDIDAPAPSNEEAARGAAIWFWFTALLAVLAVGTASRISP